MSLSITEYKFIGETISEFSERIKNKYNAKKLAVCGKLDPMAYGYIRVLLDKNTKFMEQYLDNTKKYEFFLIHGIKTNTDDILGKIITKNYSPSIDYTLDFIKSNLSKRNTQHFHPFSAIKIKYNGERKSLHQLTKENVDIPLPQKEAKILDLSISDTKTCNLNYYKKIILRQLDKIKKENYSKFEVSDIIEQWKKLEYNSVISYNIIKITVTSGYYIRMIPHYIYRELGLSSHVMLIKRIDT